MPDTYVLLSHGLLDRKPGDAGFVEWYDPNRPGKQPLIGFTFDRAKAKTFESAEAAMAELHRTRDVPGEKYNPDGSRSMPLRAFTIEIVNIEDIGP